ncbi:MAG TPA: hypothetical protein VFO60_07215 [Candidatus Dormibacteraeota bacterium]|nr:hypothetical protein [Candidatus Dormibacteraeota bacterium]
MAEERSAGRLALLVAPDSAVLSVELVLFGIWGTVAPYLGKAIGFDVDTRPINEVVDHVVPGAVVLAVSVVAIVTRRRTVGGSLAILAAGIWMTATHIPLIRQAADGQETMSAALWHSIPGMIILALGAVATLADTLALMAQERASAAAQAETDSAGPVAD